jgi:uncharacterized protein YcbK (DUF882 family)
MSRWVLFITFVLVACGNTAGPKSQVPSMYNMAKTRPDPLIKRRIIVVCPYSDEKLDVVYYHNGDYDAAVMQKINVLFRDRKANVVGKIDPELIDYLVDIRTRLGLPNTIVFQILNGYRTRATNDAMCRRDTNAAKESYHMHGWAVDFRVVGVNGRAMAEIAKTMQRGGVAYYPDDNHIHVDLGNIRTWKTK